MTEVVISLQETNEIRKKLGLKSIPEETDSGNAQHKQLSSTNSETISIEETNKIRRKLGLPLIPLPSDKSVTEMSAKSEEAQESENYQNNQNQEKKIERQERLLDNIQRHKDESRRKELLQKGSILDRLDTNNDDDDDDDDWLDNIGKSKTVYKRAIKPNSKDDNKDESIEGVEPQGTVLTLKDTNVLDDDGLDEDVEEFEDLEMVAKKKVKENLELKTHKLNNRVDLDSLNYQEDYNDDEDTEADKIGESNFKVVNGVIQKSEITKTNEPSTTNSKRKLVVLNDLDTDDDEINDYEAAKPIKMKKIKNSSSKKKEKSSSSKKRIRLHDEDIDEEPQKKEFKHVSLKHEDELDYDDSEMRKFIQVTINKKLKTQRKKKEFQLIDQDEEEGPLQPEQINDDLELDFLDNLKKQDQVSHVSSRPEVANINVKSENDETVRDKLDKAVDQGEADHNLISRSADLTPKGSVSNPPSGNYGISSALKYLSQGTPLSNSAGSAGVANQGGSNHIGTDKEIKIKYTDDDGNELNQKQAFKYLSHKFYGNGQNKRVKR